ncbi:MAG: hypothetical protein IID44_03095 [Planctomycetes bacterium]|nr:hypothetical protein [Planctomycetota bacterium]
MLQARRAILDIQDYAPATPTMYLVAPAVTINRPQRDTEVLCGVYVADCRGETAEVTYRGLGDDPAAYRLEQRHRSVRVSEAGMDQTRTARAHRLAQGEAQEADARAILEEMQQRLDSLSPEQTRRVIEMLVAT